MLIKGEERNRSKWKIGVVEHPIQGRDGVIRVTPQRAGRTHIEKPLTCNRPERRRGETLSTNAKEFQPRRARSR